METYTLFDYWAILGRRKRAFVVTATVILAVVLVIAVKWSNYRSMATIQIQAPEIPEGMTTPLGMSTTSVIQGLADQRIEQIFEQITASSILEDINSKYNLYSPGGAAARLRNNIKLTLLNGDSLSAEHFGPGQSSAIAFTLEFSYSNPVLAQKVCNELISRFITEDLRRRRLEADLTAAFFSGQINGLEKSMATQEHAIAEFRAKYPSAGPESLVFNQQMAATTDTYMQDVDRQLGTLEKERGDLRSQLALVDPYSRVISDGQVLTTPATQLKALQAQYITMTAQYGPTHPDIIRMKRQIDALQAQIGTNSNEANLQSEIVDAETRLAEAQKRYGPKYPDVVILRRQLATLEGQLSVDKRSTELSIKNDADNPAYLMLVSQIKAADTQYEALISERDQLRQQRDRYHDTLAETPVVNENLASLSRDYENAQLRYRELKVKKLTADMNAQMEQSGIAQRLVVIEPPNLPSETVPPRRLIVVAGFILSMLSGGGSAAMAEILSRSLHGTTQLARLTGRPPLAVIGHIYTERERRRRRLSRLLMASGLFLMLLIAIGVIIGRITGFPI